MTGVYQSIDPAYLREQLGDLGCPQQTLCEIVGISPTGLSLFLSGQKGLSTITQRDIYVAIQFFEEVQKRSPFPVNFAAVDDLRPHYEEFMRLRAESEVLRTQAEIEARAKETVTK